MVGCFKGKKAFYFVDMILLVCILVIFGFVSIVAYHFIGEINTDIQDDDDLSANTKDIVQDTTDRYPKYFDSFFVIVFVGLLVAVGLGAYMIRVFPALFWISLFIMVIFTFIVIVMNNLWFETLSESEFSVALQSFPMTMFIMDNFVWIMTMSGFLIAVLYFAKRNG